MTGAIQVWTMTVDALGEADVAPWRAVLDETERARADRLIFARHRVQFVAAHALARAALAAVAGVGAAEWRFRPGEHGKPRAWLGERPAAVSFNLSHTEGLVGIAVGARPGAALGFDIEAMERSVSLDVAGRYFRPEEVAWLRGLPQAERNEGFLRLWTLKEAFIKATGLGLAQGLDRFWFHVSPPRIRFTAAIADDADAWRFSQRVVAGRFLAALGVRAPVLTARWREVDAARFDPARELEEWADHG